MDDGNDKRDEGNKPKLSVVTDETTAAAASIDETSKPKRGKTARERVLDQYRLDPLDYKISEVIFEYPNASISQISVMTGINSRSKVFRRLKKPALKKRLDEMRASVGDLIKRGQLIGIRRLMSLATSKDEWVALAASKILTQQVLSVTKVTVDQTNRTIYEVQIGQQGQIFQTVKALPSTISEDKQEYPTTTELVVEGDLLKN